MGDFPKVLKKFRKEMGLTQTELAEAIGTKQSSIVRWEKGGEPRVEAFVKLQQFAWSKGYDIETPWDTPLSGLRLLGEADGYGKLKGLQAEDEVDQLIDYLPASFRDCEAVVVAGSNLRPKFENGDLLVFGPRLDRPTLTQARILLVGLPGKGLILHNAEAGLADHLRWFDAETGRDLRADWISQLVATLPAGTWSFTPRGTFKTIRGELGHRPKKISAPE